MVKQQPMMTIQTLNQKDFQMPDLTNIKLPLVVKDRILMSPGIWNDYYYDNNTIQRAWQNTDWTMKEKRALLWDHMDNQASKWIGEVINVKLDGRNMIGDLVVVNEDAARALLYGAKFGISPKVVGDEENHIMRDYTFDNFSVVINPAVKTAFINNSEVEKMEELAELTPEQRKKLPDSSFAIPEDRSYPIHDIAHARNALARVSAHGTPEEKSRVRNAVYRRYPELKKDNALSGGNADNTEVKKMTEEKKMEDMTEEEKGILSAAEKILKDKKKPEETVPPEEEMQKKEQKCEETKVDNKAEIEAELSAYTEFAKSFLEKNPGKTLSDAMAAYKAGTKLSDLEISDLRSKVESLTAQLSELQSQKVEEPDMTANKEFTMSEVEYPSDIAPSDKGMMNYLRGKAGV